MEVEIPGLTPSYLSRDAEFDAVFDRVVAGDRVCAGER